MKKLAVIVTHPIQYYDPVFKLLAERGKIQIKVFYTWGNHSSNEFDPGFNRHVEWDITLTEGYEYEMIKNKSRRPGSGHFWGIVNPDLNARIAKWKPNALLVFGWAYHSHLKALKYFKNKITVFFRGDSTLLDQQRTPKAWLKKIFLTWVYQHVDIAFYAGTENKRYFKYYGLAEDQLKFAPHAVDNCRFSADKTAEAKLFRQSISISERKIVILYVGKLEEKKDPGLLIDAFTGLKRDDLALLIVGNGALEKKLIEGGKACANIHYLGFQNQVYLPVIYQSCDIFCLPSKGPGESWGLVVNEAMAAGKAIIVSDRVGCAKDLVKQGENGIVFKAGNTEELIAGLVWLTQDKDRITSFGACSKEMIKNWNFLRIAEAVEKELLTVNKPLE